jgi:hypothetical protein
MVIINFIKDTEVGLFARTKRLAKEGSVDRNGQKTVPLSSRKGMADEVEGNDETDSVGS